LVASVANPVMGTVVMDLLMSSKLREKIREKNEWINGDYPPRSPPSEALNPNQKIPFVSHTTKKKISLDLYGS
jgi:hypothetical protein